MKKVVLLCALVCAGQLYSMEPELDPALWGQLPADVKPLIMMALAQSGDNLDSVINNIKKASLINKALNQMIYKDLKSFIALVNLLSKHFPASTKSAIAEKLNPSLAKEYGQLNKQLMMAVHRSYSIEDITQLLNKGADVNYYLERLDMTPLTLVAYNARVDLVELLLNFGANPFFKLLKNGETALDLVNDHLARVNNDPVVVEKWNKIKALLEQAMQK